MEGEGTTSRTTEEKRNAKSEDRLVRGKIGKPKERARGGSVSARGVWKSSGDRG